MWVALLHGMLGRAVLFMLLAWSFLAWPMSLNAATPEEEDVGEPSFEYEDTTPRLDALPVASGFEFPWSIGFLPEGQILVTEKVGRLQLVEPQAGTKQIIRGVPRVLAGSHAGLLDVLVDPDFAANRTVFLSYVHGTEQASTVRVMRATLVGRQLVSRKVIFESYPPAPGLEQLGGRLAMDADGLIYLTLGDRFDEKRAQVLDDDAGSIVRFDRTGQPPPTNPLIGVAGARPEIFTYGHRNPQGLAVNPATGQVWATEHGPKGGDEVNLIEAGRNYGWPVITYGMGYDGKPIGIGTHAEGMEQPLFRWTPSIAPSGLAFYRGDELVPLRDMLLVGALAGQMVAGLRPAIDGSFEETRFFVQELGRVRDIRVGPDGHVYFITDDPEGALYRITPTLDQAGRGSPNQTR